MDWEGRVEKEREGGRLFRVVDLSWSVGERNARVWGTAKNGMS